MARYATMIYYMVSDDEPEDSNSIRKWENLAVAGGIMMGLCLGGWAYYSIVYCDSAFVVLVAISTCLGQMVGVAARNFGADILVTSQSLTIGLPMVLGLMSEGDIWYISLGLLFVPFFLSSRVLAASIRSVFLQVIKSKAKIQYMAKHDILTGLPNRHSFYRLAASSRGDASKQYLIALFDIDDFKLVNDIHGHFAGDHLLIGVADRLQAQFEDPIVISRLGGDEFVVFYSGNIDEEMTRCICEKIHSCFREPFDCLGNMVDTSCSIGVVVSQSADLEMDELLMKADLALYEAKGREDSGYCLFEEEMNEKFVRKLALKEDISKAARNGELHLVFQPVFGVADTKIACCEALVRWTHSEYGSIPPDEFIPLAEAVGCVSKITRFVIWEAVAQCAQWPGSVGVAVNLSAVDLTDGNVVEEVSKALRHFRLDPKRLTLEVTETAILKEPIKATEILQDLRDRGTKIALDDFGSGYANFSYLADIPFNKLKIDRSITQRILNDERTQRLVSGLGSIAEDLNMVMTVEGVETQEQLEAILRCRNVNEIQGWIFGRPLPEADIRTLLETHSNRSRSGSARKSSVA